MRQSLATIGQATSDSESDIKRRKEEKCRKLNGMPVGSSMAGRQHYKIVRTVII